MHKVPQQLTTCQGILDNSQDQDFLIIDRRDAGAFIPSEVDDMGLSPDEFRVYARLARWQGNRRPDETLEELARACGMTNARAQRACNGLVAKGLADE